MAEQSATREPDWPTCGTGGCIGVRRDGQEDCLAHVGAQVRKTILAGLKPGADLDLRGTPIDGELLNQLLDAVRPEDGPPTLANAEFGWARFTGDADFRKAQFSGIAGFLGAQFSGYAGFTGAQFSAIAVFDKAQFSGGAAFTEAQFTRDAEFREAQFSGNADFRKARFSWDAHFNEAQFGYAVFDEAQFTGDAGFSKARFSKTARFSKAQFSDIAQFSKAQFKRAGAFAPVLAAGTLSFDHAAFEQDITIESVCPKLSCVGTRFAEAATLRLRRAQVVLDGAVFAKPSTIAFAPDPFTHYDSAAGREVERFGEGPVARTEAGLRSRPRLLSLRGVDVATLTLSELDLAACLFQGAHHLDQLRIEGTRPFASTPTGWKFGRISGQGVPVWRWTRRQSLAEEHHWRAGRRLPAAPSGRPHPQLVGWSGPEVQGLERRVQPLRPDRLAVLYRALRKAQEDSKNEPGAADFYYGEMEMRRHDPDTPWAERVILWLYWLVSGYGLRGLRALATLLVVVLLAAIGFAFWGFAPPQQPPRPVRVDTKGMLVYEQPPAERPAGVDELPAAVRFSAQSATALLRGPDRALTPLGEWLNMGLRLAGPVLVGLAVLALRGRVKR